MTSMTCAPQKMRRIVICISVAVALTPVSVAAGPLQFTDVSANSGIQSFSVSLEPPQSGSGIAVADFDANGTLDIILGGGKNRPTTLYLGNGDLTFQATPNDVSGLGGIGGDQRGVHGADYDNDGDIDIFVANWNPAVPSRLYRNDGGTFADVSDSSGVNLLGTAVCGAWGDYDNDGFLDLFVTRYWGEANVLYHNDGDGTFTIVNDLAGFSKSSSSDATLSFQAVWMDWDRDGDLDLHVMNDRCYQGMSPNQLYINQGDGTFQEDAASYGMDICLDAMGIGVADYDHDGFLDYFVSNVYYGHYFMKTGCKEATDFTLETGTSTFEWGWGVIFSDLDYDTWPDLYVATAGYITGQKPNFLYANAGDGTFTDVSVAAGATGGNKDSGCVVRGDFDQDGDDDLIVGQLFESQPYVVLRNDTTVGHAMKLRLVGLQSNRDAIGAWVQVFAGGKRYVAARHDSEAFSGTNENTMVFGLGETTWVDRIVVHWPSGAVQVVDGVPTGSIVELVETNQGGPFPLPWEERCGDGIDNDCDGLVDEGYDVGAPCTVGLGACTKSAALVCDAYGFGLICPTIPAEPAEEVLDEIDNDCDGDTDEPPPGGWPIPCEAEERCSDGVDNDCDGQTDEGFDTVGGLCTVGVGACANTGQWACAPGSTLVACDVAPGAPLSEQCDGIDNDCNGTIDDGFSVGEWCSTKMQGCTYAGAIACVGGAGATACAIPSGATPEECDPPEVEPETKDTNSDVDKGEDGGTGREDAGDETPDAHEDTDLGGEGDGAVDSEASQEGDSSPDAVDVADSIGAEDTSARTDSQGEGTDLVEHADATDAGSSGSTDLGLPDATASDSTGPEGAEWTDPADSAIGSDAAAPGGGPSAADVPGATSEDRGDGGGCRTIQNTESRFIPWLAVLAALACVRIRRSHDSA